MASIDSSTGIDTESLALEQQATAHLQEAAKNGKNIADVSNKIREKIDEIAYPNAGQVNGRMEDTREDLVDVMEAKLDDFTNNTTGYEQVQVAKLDPNVGGDALVGGTQAQARVNVLGLFDPEVKRTLAHEAHAEKGHISQAHLEVRADDAALVIDGAELSTTATYEGDVEIGSAEEMGESRFDHRDDQPEKDYAEGQRGMNDIISLVGREKVDSVLRKDGAAAGKTDVLQGAIWQAQLEESQTDETVEQIVEEAEKTGYTEQAREVILPFLQRKREELMRQVA